MSALVSNTKQKECEEIITEMVKVIYRAQGKIDKAKYEQLLKNSELNKHDGK